MCLCVKGQEDAVLVMLWQAVKGPFFIQTQNGEKVLARELVFFPYLTKATWS